ncbi:MAG: DnaB-like helicase C-terminal domain-containing protein, partial [Sphingopyxis sp.]|nr:DnaB-like helicase C-terminal domain-containing protein [Sphingopyxis sp.]
AQHEEWAAEMERVFGLAEVIIAKSRHGSIGKVRLHFEAKTTKFSDLADDSQVFDDYE